MNLYELINPSDPYTFYAPSVEIAGAAVVLLSSNYGATPVGDDGAESTPVIFGWDDWLKKKGIDEHWIKVNRLEIADALDSFLIGETDKRADVELMLEMLPEDKREEWKNKRQDRHRTSMCQIGEGAYKMAEQLRNLVVE